MKLKPPSRLTVAAPVAASSKAAKPAVAASVPVSPFTNTARFAPEAASASNPRLTGERTSVLPPANLELGTPSLGARWSVTKGLPAAAVERLRPAEKKLIENVVHQLQDSVAENKLGFVPVFGYLSLKTDNHRELGLASQADVKPGEHVVQATLPGYDIGVVASTIYRGTPRRPGVVAGLSPEAGAKTSGTLLKVPLEKAEALLTTIFAREYFSEDDLEGDKPQAMYKPVLRDVETEDGTTLKALVFITNPDSSKDINPTGALSAGQLAWFMAAEGGFRNYAGHTVGGKSLDYWRAYGGDDATIKQAIELAKLAPSDETLDYLAANASTDPRARAALERLGELFSGASVPLTFEAQQRAHQPFERVTPTRTVSVQSEIDRILSAQPPMAPAAR